MPVKTGIRIITIMVALISCAQDEDNSNIQPVINTDKYFLEITKDYSIKKVSFLSHAESENYTQEYFYSDDSVVIKKTGQQFTFTTIYFLNQSGLADSCEYITNSGYSIHYKPKSYFTYNSNGYLTSKKDRSFSSDGSVQYEYTDTYEYTMGNLTRVIFDPKKPTLTGKYVTYTYNSFQNLIDIDRFSGSWLGKLNNNLTKTYYVGGSMNDYPPCFKFEYNLSSAGLVETKTVLQCNSSNNNKTIISFEYK